MRPPTTTTPSPSSRTCPWGDYHRLEGYLYPDTYEFTTPRIPLYVINKMLVRLRTTTRPGRRQIHHFFKTLREQQNFIATQELYNK